MEGVRKYLPGWDRRVIAAFRLHRDHARNAPDRPSGRNAGRGHVGYGRPGTSGVTGARAIISPRVVLARDPVGRRGRTWSRRHSDDAEALRFRVGPGAVATSDPAGLSAAAHEGHDPG